MKRFIATMNDGSFINVPATQIVREENAIWVCDGGDIVAYVDTSALISAHISEREEKK